MYRQVRVLWFTYKRERAKCKSDYRSSDSAIESEKKRRRKDPEYPEYWERKLIKEKSFATYLSAIATFIEDAPEIILLVYIIGRGQEQQEIIGQLKFIFVDILSLIIITTVFDQTADRYREEKCSTDVKFSPSKSCIFTVGKDYKYQLASLHFGGDVNGQTA